MKSGTRITFNLSKWLLLALVLALAPAALANNTWYVDGANGSDTNNCTTAQTACKTIGHTISLASHGDSVMVAAGTYKENLSIGFSLKVIGSGASTTIIDGGGINSVVYISRNALVHLSKLTIQNGYTSGRGGGICNLGTLTLKNTTISGNSAPVDRGGGIYNLGPLTLTNTTIRGNGANEGGGISNVGDGRLTINKSTISGNSANEGGGIANAYGTLTLSNTTISGNSAYIGGGVYFNNYVYGSETVQNSIVANNISGGNCSGTMTSNGYNLSSDDTCNFNNTGDLNNTAPKLGVLKNNGGPTQTRALLRGSPAINAGNPNGCTDDKGNLLKTDQRGYPRPDKDSGRCDIGALERQHN